jgi:hypothetical protein
MFAGRSVEAISYDRYLRKGDISDRGGGRRSW